MISINVTTERLSQTKYPIKKKVTMTSLSIIVRVRDVLVIIFYYLKTHVDTNCKKLRS